MACCRVERNRGLIVIAIVAVLFLLNLLVIVSHSYDLMNHIPFSTDIFKPVFGESCCSWWPCSHFAMYTILGFVAPSCWKLWVLFGIGWEACEFIFGYFFPPKGKLSPGQEYGDADFNGWMSGNVKDIFFNTSGLIVGILLRKLTTKTS